MIKKIHYCWFGGKKLPKDVKKCIATWKKMLPDYEIKQWDETNFDINSNKFVKGAYENKKWAFVSDYVRTYALYEEGGLYLDTDVKIIKDVSNIIDKKLVFGYEDSGYFGTAVIATNEIHSKYIKEVLDYYNKIENFNVDIIYNYANPGIITNIIKKYPMQKDENGIQIFNNEVIAYPRDYFFPISYDYSEKIYTKNTCMVHLFKGTWTSKGDQRTINIYRKFGLKFGGFLNNIIDFVFNIKKNIKNSIKRKYEFIRMKISIYINRNKRVNKIVEELKNKNNDYIAVCHPDYSEIKEITYNLFKNNVIEIREQYTEKEAKMIASEIVKSNKSTVIFSSYIKGWDKIIKNLKLLNKNIKVKVISFYSNSYLIDDFYFDTFMKILDLYVRELVDKIGFVKESIYEFYKSKGYNVALINLIIDEKLKTESLEKNNNEITKVGLYCNADSWHNNIYNQLGAVSMLKNARLDCEPMNYKIATLAKKYEIILNGEKSKSLIEKIANNSINIYVTATDTISLLPFESLELGVPCLVSKNYELFNNSELEKIITVDTDDNIMQISDRINYVLDNKSKIIEIYEKWKIRYLDEARENLKEFIEK